MKLNPLKSELPRLSAVAGGDRIRFCVAEVNCSVELLGTTGAGVRMRGTALASTESRRGSVFVERPAHIAVLAGRRGTP